MAEGWRAKVVRCPFYRMDDHRKHSIICEGIGDAQRTALYYRAKDERQRIRQLEVFCQDRYENCELYRMIHESKYDD